MRPAPRWKGRCAAAAATYAVDGVRAPARGSAPMAAENPECANQCADRVSVGSKPRASLCSPWVPGSKPSSPRSMHHSMPW